MGVLRMLLRHPRRGRGEEEKPPWQQAAKSNEGGCDGSGGRAVMEMEARSLSFSSPTLPHHPLCLSLPPLPTLVSSVSPRGGRRAVSPCTRAVSASARRAAHGAVRGVARDGSRCA